MSNYLKVRGIVAYNIVRDNTRTITIKLDDAEIDKLESTGLINDEYTNNPVKTTDTGVQFKSHTQYDVAIFEDGERWEENELTTNQYLNNIGKGSEVVLNVKLAEGKFKGKPYQSAYLKAINILNLEEPVEYNPFEEQED